MMQKPVDASARMLNLGHLSTGTPLFSDHDRDGYPDRIHLSVGIAPNMNSGPVWAGLINLAARLNMESCGPGIGPPVPCMEAENGMLWVNRPAGNMPWAACLEKNRQDGWQLSGHSPLAMKQMLDALATGAISTDPTRAVRFVLTKNEAGWGRVSDQNGTDEWFRMPVPCRDTPPASPQITAISDLTDFDITSLADCLLPADSQDPRSSHLALTLALPWILSPACGRALVSLISAASARATEIRLPLAHAGSCPGGGLCLTIEETAMPEAWIFRCNNRLKAAGGSSQLSALIREVTRLWFETDAPGGESLETWKKKLSDAARLATGPRRNRPDKDHPPMQKTIDRRMTLAGEKIRILNQAAAIPRGSGPIRCRAFAGGSYPDRLAFRHQLDHVLRQKGYTPETEVLRTHKPAVSWLLEVVEPGLPREVCSLKIGCRPFSRPGQMEPEARWIREMYPAPDVICHRRGWHTNQVTMMLDPSQSSDYTVTARDAAGGKIAGFSLTVPVSELPYTLENRENQKSYLVQAGFEILRHGRRVHQCSVPTDRELFWRRFQEKWLPMMSAAMTGMLTWLKKDNALAFWEEIRIEVAMDDTQESVGLAQERIAPLEALHEDLYFGLLAFMESFRQQHCPDSRLQIGRIIPLVRADVGQRPWARLRLKPMRALVPPPRSRPVIDHIGYRN
ncbi:MAG: hypothetical protein ACNA7H_10185, partial [Desulfotignum sp.]